MAYLIHATVHSFPLQETYDTIPGQTKITFLLQAIRDASAAEEVCTLNADTSVARRVKFPSPCELKNHQGFEISNLTLNFIWDISVYKLKRIPATYYIWLWY